MYLIPFYSESAFILKPKGDVSTASLLSFSDSVDLTVSGGGIIDLSEVDHQLLEQLIYTIPKTGTLTFLTLQFSVTFAFFVSEPIDLRAQLYASFNDVFVPVHPPITLGSIHDPVYSSNRNFYEITALNIPVFFRERIFVAFYAVSPITLRSEIIGYGRAELCVEN